MKHFSKLALIALIGFLIITASTSYIGSDFEYHLDKFGWPSEMIVVTYEKAVVSNLEINFPNIAINYTLCLAAVLFVRLFFLMLKVKRKPSSNEPAWKSHPYFKENQIKTSQS
ncbi:MAG: hypothetical protein ACOVQE_02945 [Chitinophagaceae bacterium]